MDPTPFRTNTNNCLYCRLGIVAPGLDLPYGFPGVPVDGLRQDRIVVVVPSRMTRTRTI